MRMVIKSDAIVASTRLTLRSLFICLTRSGQGRLQLWFGNLDTPFLERLEGAFSHHINAFLIVPLGFDKWVTQLTFEEFDIRPGFEMDERLDTDFADAPFVLGFESKVLLMANLRKFRFGGKERSRALDHAFCNLLQLWYDRNQEVTPHRALSTYESGYVVIGMNLRRFGRVFGVPMHGI